MSTKKSRFDGLDVAAMTSHLRRTMLGFKVANVYDGSALGVGGTSGSGGGGGGDGGNKGGGVYVFKLADPSGGPAAAAASTSAASTANNNANASAVDAATVDEQTPQQQQQQQQTQTQTPQPKEETSPPSKRAMLLLESGVRFHPTLHTTNSASATSSNSAMPSAFCMKLRKHLRNLRLENISQLGNLDRVVDFKFGSGRYAHHLILELYSLGNVILTDGEYRILGLLRVHEYEIKKDENVDGNVDGNVDVVDGKGEKEDTKKEKDVGGKKKKEEVKVRVGNIYPVTFATTLSAHDNNTDNNTKHGNDKDGKEETTTEASTSSSSSSSKGLLSMNSKDAYHWAKSELIALHQRVRDVNNSDNNESGNGNGNNNNGKGGGGGNKGGGKKKKGAANAGGKKKAMDDSLVLKALLLKPNSGVYHYGPSLIEHCIRTAGLDPLLKLSHDNIDYTLPEEAWNDLTTCLRIEGAKVIEHLTSGESGGYILYKLKQPANDSTSSTNNKNKNNQKNDSNSSSLLPTSLLPNQNPHSDKILLEFQPHLLHQHQHQSYLAYTTFAMAIDEFFAHLSSQRMAHRADAAEAAAMERLSKIQLDQQRRVEGLVSEQERWRDSARLVEMHAEDIDRALGVINSALATGMDWEALEQLVSVEQGNDNPIALLIHRLELEKDRVVLALPDIDDWDESDPDRPPKLCHATVSIKESAHGNARDMFAHYRAFKEKEEKTMEASTMALKAAEAKAKMQLAEAQKKKQRIQVLPPRKVYWFEKFAWFITSDNYMVVAGRDAQQNEQLVKRYLRPGDAYLHAEVHGAATCILRAKRRRRKDGKTRVLPLSDQALREAGTFTICRSSAWGSKMVTSAYWVESHQVSKTAPTGEYLTVGSFMIRGRKNFLPASSLEMGMGVLFRLGDEASVARHANERRDFALMEQEELFVQEEEENKGKDEEGLVPLSSVMEQSDDDAQSEKEKDHANSDDDKEKSDEQGLDDDQNSQSPETEESPEQNLFSDEVAHAENESSSPSVSFKIEAGRPKANNSKKKSKELSRGKRSKNKRAQKKYSEQDEEDRALAMMALQGGESFKKGKKGGGSRIAATVSEIQQKAGADTVALLVRDSKDIADTLDKSVQDILAECVTVKVTKSSEGVRWGKFDAEALEQLREMDTLEEQLAVANRLLDLSNATRIDNYSASLAGIIRTIKKHGVDKSSDVTRGDGKQRKTKAEKQAEKEVWQEILAEDGIIENDGDDDDGPVDDTAELAKLTGKPTAQDVILCAIPVCAPYSVLSQYKYRVKLTPGSVKRGKASKQCVELFLHNDGDKKKPEDEGAKRDRELIKLVNENEWVQSIIGDVRITSAGASKVAKKQRGKSKK